MMIRYNDNRCSPGLFLPLQPHDISHEGEKARIEGAGGSFSDGRLLGILQPTRGFGNLDIHR